MKPKSGLFQYVKWTAEVVYLDLFYNIFSYNSKVSLYFSILVSVKATGKADM